MTATQRVPRPVPILWKCTWCGARMALPALWEHLREAHGWDRDAYQSVCDRPRVPRDKVVVEMPLGPYRWNHEED